MEGGKFINRGENFFIIIIIFSLLFTSQNDLNLFHAGIKIRRNDLAPSEKNACYAPAKSALFRPLLAAERLTISSPSPFPVPRTHYHRIKNSSFANFGYISAPNTQISAKIRSSHHSFKPKY